MRPTSALPAITWMTLALKRNRAMAAPNAIKADIQSKSPPNPFGHLQQALPAEHRVRRNRRVVVDQRGAEGGFRAAVAAAG